MTPSASSSSDLEAPITQQITQKKDQKVKKKRTKEKSKLQLPTVATEAKNEGDDPHWAYEPPADAVLLDHAVDAGAFEWDALNDDEDTEIWVIRAPDMIRAKHLEGLEIDPPLFSRTARIGGLTRKTASYDIWSIAGDDADVAGGEELLGLSCLLPRKSKEGKLYMAPKEISHHIVISATPSMVTLPEGRPVMHRIPSRLSYPRDLLKHAFVPYGARSKQISEAVPMDVGDTEPIREEIASAVAPTSSKDKPPKSKDSKRKKRKAEGETPKKSKKHKAES